MHKVIEELVRLQEYDRRLIQLRNDLTEIPARKELVRRRAIDRESAFKQAEDAWKKHAAAMKELDNETEAAKERIARYRKQQFEVKTNADYRTLEHEIANEQGKIKSLEDRELDEMELAEQFHDKMAVARREMEEERTQVEKDCADLDRRAEVVTGEMAEAEAERQKQAAAIEAEWLARYDRILKHRGDFAVVPVENGACGGCHMKLTPQVIQDTKRSQDVCACTYCGRMLYWKD